MADLVIPVLISGGVGTRLWPASVEARPKPFLPLVGGASTFALTLERIGDPALFAPPIVVANAQQRYLVEAALAEASATELQRAPRGPLAIVAPVGFGSRVLAPALAGWIATHPEVSVELTLDDRPEARIAKDCELGIVSGDVRDTALVARPLRPYRRVLAAAPRLQHN